MKRYAVALQVAGLVTVTVGASLIAIPAGLLFAGAALLVLGAMEESNR